MTSTAHACNLQQARSISFLVRLCIEYLLLRCCIFSHVHHLFSPALDRSPSVQCLQSPTRTTRVPGLFATMGIISSFLGAIAKLLSGSEDRPQPPPPQERPPQQPQRPHRPYRPQEERPPQSYPPSTSPPKHQQPHKPHSPRPPKHHPVRL